MQATWTSPRTNRLLLEAGATVVMFHYPMFLVPGVSEDFVSILEQSTNFRYNAPATYVPERNKRDRYSQRFALSYVTGSHAFKFGIQQNEGHQDEVRVALGLPGEKGVGYTFNRGVPVSLNYSSEPHAVEVFQKAELGVYAQDQWVLKGLTLNYGLRFDYVNGYVPPLHLDAGPFLPERNFDAVHKVPNWMDWNPRVGLSYDLRGNGRTAVKVSLGRYGDLTNPGFITSNAPVNTAVNAANRSWTDTNGNYRPDCDLKNFTANGECGPISNQNFGKNNPDATKYADDVRTGFGARMSTWDFGSEIQHQLAEGVSVTAGYYRNWDVNFHVTDNTAVGPEDFDPYCIIAPVDARLPGGGGYEVCGLYDIKPSKFGLVTNRVTQSSNFGEQSRVNDFFAVKMEARIGNAVRLSGGVDTGRTVTDNCYVIDSPQQLLNCRVVTPLAGNTQVKVNGTVPLPGEFVVSGTFQSVAGPTYTASYAVGTAQIAPSLGRPLAGGARTATVPLLAPETLREERHVQLDLRVSKILRLGSRVRAQANFDMYNALNASPVLGANSTYGASWRLPTLVLNGRLLQVSANLTF